MVGTPLVQSRPAGGAGAAFACSDLAACSIASLGVKDHHLLTGRDHDDHSLYALADKTRPSPWVSAGDLAARSLADLGTKDHHLLAGLLDDDHSIYLLKSGRAGGQTIYGGVASHENLTLHSTVHPTPGYIRLQDDLQLLSNIIRDSGATARLTLATASPHVSLVGDLDVSGHAAIGDGASPSTEKALQVVATLDTHPAVAGYFNVVGNRAAGVQFTYGQSGGASGQGTPSATFVYGLYFFAQHNSPSPCYQMGGILIQQQSGSGGTGALSIARGLYLSAAYWGGTYPLYSHGLDIEDQGHASTTVAYGVLVDDQTGIMARLLELGPATPYLRLVGGGAPAANESNLYLRLGATLKQLTEYDADSAGVGYRALRVPN